MADKTKKANRFGLIGKKIAKFFIELKSELKKVVWPDRKKLTQSTITVVLICLFAAVLIFSVDKILSGTLNAIGFFPKAASVSTTAVSDLLPSISTSATSSAVSSAVGSTVS
jgi:preprotein translocase subunit SecE